MTTRGIDTDNYDGPIPFAHFQRLHDVYGVRFNIPGLEAQMPYAAAQRDASIAAGIDVPFAYKFLYWAPNDLDRMKQATTFGKPIAIDCEAAVPATWSKAQVIDSIHAAKDVLQQAGLYWGIYTGAWWWPGATGDNKDFAGDRLWHAAYPFGQGVLPPSDYLPPDFGVNYGGWTKATVLQYADTCYEDAAWHLDMNAMESEPVLPPVKRIWLYGDERAGLELRGAQQVCWSQWVEAEIRGDAAGLFPGRIAKNFGGEWWWLRKSDQQAGYWSREEGD